MVREPLSGENVMVPWGRTSVAGEVVEVYGPPERRHVVVSVAVSGSTGEPVDRVMVAYQLGDIEMTEAVRA